MQTIGTTVSESWVAVAHAGFISKRRSFLNHATAVVLIVDRLEAPEMQYRPQRRYDHRRGIRGGNPGL